MAETGNSQATAGASKVSVQPSQAGVKIRRRNRIITSCLECRRRKLKCDRSHPCNHCAKASRDCVFLSPALDSVSKGKLNQFKESIDHLEKGLERQAGSGSLEWTVSSPSESGVQSRNPAVAEPIPEDEQNLEPSPLTVADVAYDDDGDDLMEDLGIRLGKIRITERIGGFIRPKFSMEMAERIVRNNDASSPDPNALENYVLSPPTSEGGQSYLEPGPEYIAPGTNLLFPNTSQEDISLVTFLPSRDFADRLILRYWNTVHNIARIVHRPSFERQYSHFWADVAQGFEPAAPLQALVLAAMFSAAVALPTENAEQEFGCGRDDMVRTFRAGCEHALSRANLIRTTKTGTLQAFVMYLIPLCRAEVSRSHASLVSMAIRLAECAGLHRDPTTFGLPPIEVHVRRMIWYQLCFLDTRTVEAVGPRPTIRFEDYDTKLPLNVDDVELESLVPPRQDVARFTDMTLSRIRFEAWGMLRTIWFQRPLIEKGLSSLTSLLKRVDEWREQCNTKWIPLINKSVPLQHFTAKTMQLFFHKMRINILHRYAVSVPQKMPERLMELVWSSALGMLEVSIELDTWPDFKPWAWYLGATQQWHVAILLIFMVGESPNRPEADRIWVALDYIFELPSHLGRVQKIDYAMMVAKHRLDEDAKQRRQRFPTNLEQNLGVPSRPSEPYHRDSISSSHSSRLPASPIPPDQALGLQAGNQSSTSESWVPSQTPATRAPSFSPHVDLRIPSFSAVEQSSAQQNAFSNPLLSQPQNAVMASGNTSAAQQQSFQHLADLDMDELNQIFPVHDPFLDYDPSQQSVTSSGIPAMTFFPSPIWPKSSQAGNSGFQ